MVSEFVIHHHKTGRSHFDLRVVQNGVLRSWSLLKEPPSRNGERRLAIERENFPVEAINRNHIEEEAFGFGRVTVWDRGKADITAASPKLLIMSLKGSRLSGKYEFRRMFWYPGNRWLMTKLQEPAGAK
jgi:DNA ligase D-like protein (predicted 3'-phosphoesterase)